MIKVLCSRPEHSATLPFKKSLCIVMAGGLTATYSMSSTTLASVLAGAALAGLCWWYCVALSVPLPPGPRGNFLFGSALEVFIHRKARQRPRLDMLRSFGNRPLSGSTLPSTLTNMVCPPETFEHLPLLCTTDSGPIITVRMLFQKVIIIDDPKIIIDLFEKKAAQYSDRYVSQLAKLCVFVPLSHPAPDCGFLEADGTTILYLSNTAQYSNDTGPSFSAR
jgi:hypothetical protein